MKIRIIHGGAGLETGHGVVLKTPKDAPFVVDDELAARWITDGIAEEVAEGAVKGENKPSEGAEAKDGKDIASKPARTTARKGAKK